MSLNNKNFNVKNNRSLADLLISLSARANMVMSSDEFLYLSVKETGKILKASTVEIIRLNPLSESQQEIYSWESRDYSKVPKDYDEFNLNEAKWWNGEFSGKKSLVISDVSQIPLGYEKEFFTKRSIKTVAAFALETINHRFGFFIVQNKEQREWTEYEINVLSSYVSFLALTICNRETEEKVTGLESKLKLDRKELAQKKHELELKNRISLHLSDKDDLNEVMDAALELLSDFFKMDNGCFYVLRDNNLFAEKSIGLSPEKWKYKIAFNEGFNAVEKGYKNNLPRLVQESLEDDEHSQVGSWISIPLYANNNFLGAILLGTSEFISLDELDTRFFEALGAQIGVYLQNTLSRERLREYSLELDWKVNQRTMELEVLYELSTEIAHSLNYSKVMEVILNTINRILDYDLSAYILTIEEHGKYVVRLNCPIKDETYANYVKMIRDKFVSISRDRGAKCPPRPTRVARGDFYDEDEIPETEEIGSTYYIPIKMEENVVGILNISSFEEDSFPPQQIKFLNTIAVQASMSLTQLRQFLETRKTTFQNILENIKSGVILVDPDYSVKMANPAGTEMLKSIAKTQVGEKIATIGKIPIETLAQDILWNRVETVKREIMITSDTTKYYQVTLSPFKAGGVTVIGAIMVIQDVTEEKVANQQLMQIARMVSVGELAAGVAHEINNPLTGILGFSELLLEQNNLEPDMQEIIRDIYSSGKRASQITEDLLRFARNQREPTKDVIDLVEVLDITLKLVVSQYKKLNINIIKDYPEERLYIYGNSGKVQQAVLNLIGNAKDAMIGAKKGSRITVSGWKEPNGAITLRIRDDGPGIPKKLQQRIFDPFFTTKEVGKGTGLGLSITYRIIDDHGGTIFMESEEGKYTQFKITFPPPSPTAKSKSSQKQKTEAQLAHKLRILAIDDEAMILKFISKYYTKLGYNVLTANSPHLGIKAVEQNSFDLVLLDFRMPGMNGEEMYERIIKIQPELKDKIVMVTGDVMGEEVRTFLERTNVRFLLKPMDLKDLRKLVES